MLKREALLARCVGLSLLLVSSSATAEDKPGTQPADVVESKDKATVAKDKPGTPAVEIVVKPIKYVDIKAFDFDWNVPTDDIESVLNLATKQLLPHVLGHGPIRVLVYHQDVHPKTLYAKGPAGEYQVLLSARGANWHKYAYQFAHELGHIIAYSSQRRGKNQWFEEAICEASSLFVLAEMGTLWTNKNKSLSAFPSAKDSKEDWYEWHANVYFNFLLSSDLSAVRLPPDQSMPQWIRNNILTLSKQDELTDQSQLVAAYLLPLFQDAPQGWTAITSLPSGEKDVDLDFEQYLEVWRSRASDDKSKQLVSKIQNLFGYKPRTSETETSPTNVRSKAPGTLPEQPSLPK